MGVHFPEKIARFCGRVRASERHNIIYINQHTDADIAAKRGRRQGKRDANRRVALRWVHARSGLELELEVMQASSGAHSGDRRAFRMVRFPLCERVWVLCNYKSSEKFNVCE